MKKILVSFLFLFSFSANAQLYKVTQLFSTVYPCVNVKVGDIVSSPYLGCNGYVDGVYTLKAATHSSTTNAFITKAVNDSGRTRTYYLFYASRTSCPEGTEYNPDTNSCDAPEPPFCSSQQVADWIASDSKACEANGGKFSYTCNEEKDEYKHQCKPGEPPPPVDCDDPNNSGLPECDKPVCKPFGPGWPACEYPPLPETPDNPNIPGSGGNGSTVDPTKPLDPNPEIPPVDPLPPDEGNGNILKAIANLNKDNNTLLTRLNKDMNTGFSNTTDYLKAINENSINMLDLARLGFDNINQSINNQNDVIRETGNMTNNYLGTLTNVTGNGLKDVVDAVNNIGDKLDRDKMIDIDEHDPTNLYTQTQLSELNKEVEQLKEQYNRQLNEFKAYFNFKTDVKDGEYNPHTLKQNWGGQELSFDNFVLTVFVDNAHIIGLIVMFGFGMAGIRIILETI
ncbi:hypothetical protein ACTFQF_16885 [Aliivibrio fischeri]|uniref:hypothetical protein n=1 Tax=Aliivibrio fischeri TaxID=668 RepID=UPI000AD40BEC|nr:hypothetical protein [Aliivibrio fischeri]MBP3140303.1 hypothetical protein [Aliivibrio fischeri]MBP3140312.1 hypothetical protein [Aliivibrio fischeri]MBP3154689.1 hypothetical protein [Aliivibrio fischeri]